MCTYHVVAWEVKGDVGDGGEVVTDEVGESGEAGIGGEEQVGVRGEDVALGPGGGEDHEGPDVEYSELSPDQLFSSQPDKDTNSNCKSPEMTCT